jgi:hypothetical protein
MASKPGLQKILSNSTTGSPVASPNLAANTDFPAPPAPTTTTRLTAQIVPHPSPLFLMSLTTPCPKRILFGCWSCLAGQTANPPRTALLRRSRLRPSLDRLVQNVCSRSGAARGSGVEAPKLVSSCNNLFGDPFSPVVPNIISNECRLWPFGAIKIHGGTVSSDDNFAS